MPIGRFDVLRDALISIAGTEYQSQCKKARFVPAADTVNYPVLVPEGQISDVGNATWTLELAGLQYYAAGGLTEYMNAHHGEEVVVVIAPKNEAAWPEYTATVVCMAQPIGGDVGQMAEFDTTLPVKGSPVAGTVAS